MKYADWPTKEEAAQRIGVSVKTVERLADDKKLQQKLRPRPGGTPLAVFNPADVERVASERAAAASRPFVMPASAGIIPATPTLPALLRSEATAAADFAELLGAAIAKALAEDRAKALAEERAPVFAPAEAARYARRSVENLRELRKQGKLPNAGTPGHVLYRRADLDKL